MKWAFAGASIACVVTLSSIAFTTGCDDSKSDFSLSRASGPAEAAAAQRDEAAGGEIAGVEGKPAVSDKGVADESGEQGQ
jgi:hypothetical protein